MLVGRPTFDSPYPIFSFGFCGMGFRSYGLTARFRHFTFLVFS